MFSWPTCMDAHRLDWSESRAPTSRPLLKGLGKRLFRAPSTLAQTRVRTGPSWIPTVNRNLGTKIQIPGSPWFVSQFQTHHEQAFVSVFPPTRGEGRWCKSESQYYRPLRWHSSPEQGGDGAKRISTWESRGQNARQGISAALRHPLCQKHPLALPGPLSSPKTSNWSSLFFLTLKTFLSPSFSSGKLLREAPSQIRTQ